MYLQTTGRGRILHCPAYDIPDPAGAGGALRQGSGRALCQPEEALHSGIRPDYV